MRTYVLVHGGWHGAWCWSRVVPLLRDVGHTVLTPTLTGLGECAHLATPEVDVSTHVRDVVESLHAADASDVVLVGHSYSGVVVTGVAAAVPDRVAELVYLDAFVPEEGRTLFDLLPTERAAMFEDAARDRGNGWTVPLPWEQALAGWGVTDPGDLAWMIPLMTPQPLGTFVEPAGPWASSVSVPRTFVHCREKAAGDAFAPFAAAARAAPGWTLITLDAGHDAMVTAPDALATALLSVIA